MPCIMRAVMYHTLRCVCIVFVVHGKYAEIGAFLIFRILEYLSTANISRIGFDVRA